MLASSSLALFALEDRLFNHNKKLLTLSSRRCSRTKPVCSVRRSQQLLQRAAFPVSKLRVIAAASSAAASWPSDSADQSNAVSSGQEGLQSNGNKASEATGNASFEQAVCNLLNILVGVGLLSLPYALRQGGWLCLAFIPMIATVTTYTGKALVECSNTVAKANGMSPSEVGYPDVAAAAFGPSGKAFVSATVYAELFGICSLFFIIMGDNLHHLLASSYGHTPAFYMLVAAGLMIPTVWLPDLKALSYLGFAGICATAAVVFTVIWTFATGSYGPGGPTQLVNVSKLPAALGMFTFCFSGHGIFPTVEASMKEPKRFPEALNVAFATTAALCALVASLGYRMYGSAVRDVVTFNLPKGLLSLIVSCLILVSPWAKFALTAEPIGIAIDNATSGIASGASPQAKRLVVRTALALSMLGAAWFCPFLSLVISLIGSFLTVNVSLIFPAILHLKLHQGKLSSQRQYLNYGVILLGVLAMVSGTWTSIASIIKA